MSKTSETGKPIHVDSSEQFHQLLSDHEVVVVDYYADWCGPCKMMEPTIEELAAETDAAVLKLDIEAHQDLASEAGVRSIPTIQFLRNGEEAERLVGVQEKENMLDVIESL
ncbi:MAG: thioredoxin [Halobaculum sp.]